MALWLNAGIAGRWNICVQQLRHLCRRRQCLLPRLTPLRWFLRLGPQKPALPLLAALNSLEALPRFAAPRPLTPTPPAPSLSTSPSPSSSLLEEGEESTLLGGWKFGDRELEIDMGGRDVVGCCGGVSPVSCAQHDDVHRHVHRHARLEPGWRLSSAVQLYPPLPEVHRELSTNCTMYRSSQDIQSPHPYAPDEPMALPHSPDILLARLQDRTGTAYHAPALSLCPRHAGGRSKLAWLFWSIFSSSPWDTPDPSSKPVLCCFADMR